MTVSLHANECNVYNSMLSDWLPAFYPSQKRSESDPNDIIVTHVCVIVCSVDVVIYNK